MTKDSGIIGRDIYLRYDRGPVQMFRVWDADLFIARQVDAEISAVDKNNVPAPYVVSVASVEDYLSEKKSGHPQRNR